MANLQNIQAETGLISTLIVHPEFVTLNEKLKPEHFSIQTNGILFNIISSLYKDGVTNIDEFNLKAKIDNVEEYSHLFENINLEEIVQDSPYVARDSTNEYKVLASDVL